MLFLIAGRQIWNITEFSLKITKTKIDLLWSQVPVEQHVPVVSHWVVVHRSVFGSIPLKHKLPVVQMASSPAFFDPTQVTFLKGSDVSFSTLHNYRWDMFMFNILTVRV